MCKGGWKTSPKIWGKSEHSQETCRCKSADIARRNGAWPWWPLCTRDQDAATTPSLLQILFPPEGTLLKSTRQTPPFPVLQTRSLVINSSLRVFQASGKARQSSHLDQVRFSLVQVQMLGAYLQCPSWWLSWQFTPHFFSCSDEAFWIQKVPQSLQPNSKLLEESSLRKTWLQKRAAPMTSDLTHKARYNCLDDSQKYIFLQNPIN